MEQKAGESLFQVVVNGHSVRLSRFDSRRWVRALLFEKLRCIVHSESLRPGEKLLDYGCGKKPYEKIFRGKFRQYVGADFGGNERADLVIGPQGQLPVDDESFDCVLSTQVLEHVEDVRLYLREANRALRPGGSLVLSTHGFWKYHPDPADYWRWTLEGIQLEIRRAGFDIVATQSIFGLTSTALQLWQDATASRVPRPIRPIYIWHSVRDWGDRTSTFWKTVAQRLRSPRGRPKKEAIVWRP